MERQKKVVDASVIMKWFVDEDGSDKALDLRKMHLEKTCLIIVPDLLFIEVMNAFRYKTEDVESLKKVNDALWKIQLKVEKTNQFILNAAAEEALIYDLSLYDAIYVTLSQLYGCPLYTSDLKLKKCKNVVMV